MTSSLEALFLDITFAGMVNHRSHSKQPCKPPEMLAKYWHSLLKKSTKEISETEVNEKNSHCITIFKYLNDKDVFLRFYSNFLAKRWIRQLSKRKYAAEVLISEEI